MLCRELIVEYGVEVLVVNQDLFWVDVVDCLCVVVVQCEIGLLVYNVGGDLFIMCFLVIMLDNWDLLLYFNVFMLMVCCYVFGGWMLFCGCGGVILVGLQVVLGGICKLVMYSVSKVFVLNFGELLWVEWWEYGVDVLNLLIGIVDILIMCEVMFWLNIFDVLNMLLFQVEDIVVLVLCELFNGLILIYFDDLEGVELWF